MRVVRALGPQAQDALREAVEVLERGGIVAYPTETFYGLGAKYDEAQAVERLHALKRRPAQKAIPLVVGERSALRAVARDINQAAQRLMERYWPGPLTLLLPAREGLSPHLSSNGKVAVRVPGPSFALDLARAAGFPITATSANPSGMPPATRASQVEEYFAGGIDLLVDGGETPGGEPSTVADASGGRLTVVRRGRVRIGEEDGGQAA
ncbi:MAG: L-threonylcarbamoyladenylate synthase [Thermodesulfovibrionales bacterium]